ncbi:methyltransferase-like protein 17, mitochondrial [Anthonomus grandis grandis]|uniref:methyltransferase-like protein 17, mitochondrial n=1 Tax=Anthonomus grandis grandis TaxID=2921223 RepID=UPI0021659BB7|nr:methyltransferase-like protein 17, mitochondrial [Anthonomus grandis grandis]
MILNKGLRGTCAQCLRNWSTSSVVFLEKQSKYAVTPDENVLKDLRDEVYKPRKHPGVMKESATVMPEGFVKAALNTVADYPVKALVESGNTLSRHLKGRVPPMERTQILRKYEQVRDKVLRQHLDREITSQEEERRFRQMSKDKIDNIMREKIYNWKPMRYDVYSSLAYLLVRAPAEYAVLRRILGEIARRDPEFTPRSLFDFGSGVGTVTWAANFYWKNQIYEYFNVDCSSDMNDLAQVLLQGGRGNAPSSLKGAFFRQFLPASNVGYDLVASAYSMMELPSMETRLDTILNLWNKTQKYLVVVEQGTNAGFKVINEIRDFILQIDKEGSVGHVFAPCPHDQSCPRYVRDDGTPCNFEVRYWTMPVGQKSECRTERYCYVVLRKGKREDSDQPKWPRLVRPTLVKSKHTLCRICSCKGQLEDVIFTKKKHGKLTYHCARASRWGDLLPITLETNEEINNKDTED